MCPLLNWVVPGVSGFLCRAGLDEEVRQVAPKGFLKSDAVEE